MPNWYYICMRSSSLAYDNAVKEVWVDFLAQNPILCYIRCIPPVFLHRVMAAGCDAVSLCDQDIGT